MLTFIYSTVNAGKSANLLMRAHSCSERGMKFLILVPDVSQKRDGASQVASRIGFTHEAISLSKTSNPAEVVLQDTIKNNVSVDVVFVDEAQFLTKEQVLKLTVVADKIEEIATFAVGGEKAIFNAKVDESGGRITEGESVDAGFHYVPLTRSDFNLSQNHKD